MAAPSTDFEALYDQATELLKAFPEYQFKTVTALLVIIGWLVSSDTAQHFIFIHRATTLPLGVAAFYLLAVLKAIWIYGHHRRVNDLHLRLVELAPANSMSAEAVAQLSLGWVLPLTYLLVNVMLCTTGSVVLWLVCQ